MDWPPGGWKSGRGGANTLTDADAARFDVVIANINRNILMEDMAAYAATMKPACTLMLSGFMQPDVAPLEAEAVKHGLCTTGLREEGEWRILSLRR